jgi:hypothetical protein
MSTEVTKMSNNKYEISKKKLFGLLAIAVILGSLLTATMYVRAPTTPTFTIGPYPGAPDYTVYSNGTWYFAKDSYGDISYMSSNSTTVVQSCIDALSTGIVYVKGFIIPEAVTFKSGVWVDNFYDGFMYCYPFPRIFQGSLSCSDIWVSGGWGFKDGWLHAKMNKDLWIYDMSAYTGMDAFMRQNLVGSIPMLDFGTYTWTYYCSGWETGKEIWFGWALAGWCTCGAISIGVNSIGTCEAITSYNETSDIQTIVGWNYNVPASFRLEYTPTYCKWYINGTLMATNTLHIPQEALPFATEIVHSEHNGDFSADTWQYMKDIRRIA